MGAASLVAPPPLVVPTLLTGSLAWEGVAEEEIYVGRGWEWKRSVSTHPSAIHYGDGEPLL